MRVHLLQGALGVCGTGASTRGTVNIKTIMGTRDTMLYLLHPLYIRDTRGTSRLWGIGVQVLQKVQEGYERHGVLYEEVGKCTKGTRGTTKV